MLQQLPENGDVSELTSLQLEESATEEHEQPLQEHLHGAHLPSSFVLSAVQQHTEQKTVRQSIKGQQSGSAHTLMWPTIGGTPINEFTTEGYFSMAFPTLPLTRLYYWPSLVTSIAHAHIQHCTRSGLPHNACIPYVMTCFFQRHS